MRMRMAPHSLHWSRWLLLLAMPLLATMPVPSLAAERVQEIRLVSSPTMLAFARDITPLLKQEKRVNISLSSVGSEAALDEVAAGRVDAALISRALTEKETHKFHARQLGKDRLLLIVNERNPIHTIDESTVRGIFKRQLSDWRQIGAGNVGPVVPVTRGAAHGTRTLFDTHFSIGRIVPTGIVELDSNLATVLYVGADPQAIGFASTGSFDDARRRGLRIKSVTVITPPSEDETCPGAGYLLCRPLNLVRLQGSPTRTHQIVEAFLLGPQGQALMEQHGFSPPTLQ